MPYFQILRSDAEVCWKKINDNKQNYKYVVV